jgi:hypothetical protein
MLSRIAGDAPTGRQNTCGRPHRPGLALQRLVDRGRLQNGPPRKAERLHKCSCMPSPCSAPPTFPPAASCWKCSDCVTSDEARPHATRSLSGHQCPYWRRCEQDFGGVMEGRSCMRHMSSQKICIGVNRLHRFSESTVGSQYCRTGRWGCRPPILFPWVGLEGGAKPPQKFVYKLDSPSQLRALLARKVPL